MYSLSSVKLTIHLSSRYLTVYLFKTLAWKSTPVHNSLKCSLIYSRTWAIVYTFEEVVYSSSKVHHLKTSLAQTSPTPGSNITLFIFSDESLI